MTKSNRPDVPTPEEPTGDLATPASRSPRGRGGKGRRLSVVRMGVAVLVIGAAGLGSTKVTIHTMEERERLSTQWFAPYVDVTLPPFLNFQDPQSNPSKDVALAFVVASADEPCTPTWGAAYDLDAAASELDLDRRIVRHRQRGGDVIVSFGGVANDELAVTCTDPGDLADAYRQVIDRYELQVIDLDIEASGLDGEATIRRAEAIAVVQAEKAEAGAGLDVWLTLPVAPNGLQDDGVAVVDAMLAAGVDLAGVNIMTMEFGASRGPDMDFVEASLAAIDATAAQLRTAYRRAGVVLTEPESFVKVGVTPMIGQNDAPSDRLDVAGARRLADQASRRGITRFSMWSLNRDVACSGNVDPSIANTSCSGVEQERLEFSSIFGAVNGRAVEAVPEVDDDGQSARIAATDDALGAGPYDDWRPRREYEMATKVVWRGQVYEAKWWNVQAQPDAPVEHEWDSPWRIIGPVLPTDEPMSSRLLTLPDGTYPEWRSRATYEAGDRVQHRGIGYRAKWWTQGNDPTADVDNTWQNAWEPLTLADVPPSDLAAEGEGEAPAEPAAGDGDEAPVDPELVAAGPTPSD